MRSNIFLKLLSSLPVILIFLYFVPFLGICLLLIRCFVYTNKKISTPIVMIVIGGLILIPKGLSLLKINILTNDILKWYNSDLLKYSKLLLTVGIIFLLISCITNNIFNKFVSFITSYINSHEKREREISEKNDLLMKEKQEKAKNTKVVYCPYCGADNMLTEKVGTCKYCRRKIQATD